MTLYSRFLTAYDVSGKVSCLCWLSADPRFTPSIMLFSSFAFSVLHNSNNTTSNSNARWPGRCGSFIGLEQILHFFECFSCYCKDCCWVMGEGLIHDYINTSCNQQSVDVDVWILLLLFIWTVIFSDNLIFQGNLYGNIF